MRYRPSKLALAVLPLLLTFSLPTGAQPDVRVSPELEQQLAQAGVAKVIILLEKPFPTLGAEAQRAALRPVKDQVISQLGTDFQLVYRYESLPALAGVLSAAGLDALRNNPNVRAVSPSGRARPVQTEPGLTLKPELFETVPFINADDVHGQGFTGQGVNVAVLDTGIDTDHPDLSDDLVAQSCFLSNLGGTCPSPNPAEDGTGHGTHVSGIITSGGVAVPLGTAPDAGVIAVKVFDDNENGDFADIIAGLDWLNNNHGSLSTDVVNLSLGGELESQRFSSTCDSFNATAISFKNSVDNLRDKGMAVFAASGNDADTNGILFPACLSNVAAVGAVYDQDYSGDFPSGINWGVCSDPSTAADQVACFSNSNSLIDLWGPGAFVLTANNDGSQIEFNGTSAATPHLSGVAALLLDRDGTLTPSEVENALSSTGVSVTDTRNGVTRPRVDALAAFNALGGSDPSSAVFTVGNDGTVSSDRAYHGSSFNSGSGADLAEGISSLEPLNPGDVVEIDPAHPGFFRKSRGTELVVGVVSTRPGMTLAAGAAFALSPLSLGSAPGALALDVSLDALAGGRITRHPALALSLAALFDALNRPLLALAGRVPVRASAAEGAIRPGDLLTASIEQTGVAVRCALPCARPVIGKALAPLPRGVGLIEMLVLRP